MSLKIKRIYEPYAASDGWRVLVDRVWARGISKEEAHLDAWTKDLAPSTALRKWFGHIPEKFVEFADRYQSELDNNPEIQETIQELLAKSAENQVTLVYSAKDTEHNQAVVLRDYLQEKASAR